MNRKFSGIFGLLLAAALGYVLITLPPYVFAEYEKISAQSPFLGWLYAGVVGIVMVGLVTAGSWTGFRLWRNSRQNCARRARDTLAPSQFTEDQKVEAIIEKFAEADSLTRQAPIPAEEKRILLDVGNKLQEKLKEQTLEIVAFGTISSGKSSLLNALAGRDVFHSDVKGGTTVSRDEVAWAGDHKVVLVDTPGLGEVSGNDQESMARNAARDADLVLFVLDGAMKDFEFRVLQQLGAIEKRIVVCLNKQDWFTDENRALLLKQIRGQARKYVPDDYVLAVRSRSATRTRIRVESNGTEHEETVVLEPEIGPLADHLLKVLNNDRRELLLANLLLRSRGLLADVRERIRGCLDREAETVVARHMWQAGGAAALAPLPLLDVIAAVTISSKMVFELARVYGQRVDLESARRLVGELGKNLVGVLGANLAAPALSTLLATTLKIVPGIGTIAGGVLQGLTQALITRWIGKVFIVYFGNEMQEPAGGLAALAHEQWKAVTTPAALTELAQVGIARLRSKETS